MGVAGATCLVLALSLRRAASGPIDCPARPAFPPLPRFEPDDLKGPLDVGAELRDVVAELAEEFAAHGTRVQVAVQPGLRLRSDPGTLRAIVTALIMSAADDESCGWILVSAIRQSGRIRVAVTDDGHHRASSGREAEFRRAEQLIALQGGSMHIDMHPDGGTTVALRLPIPHGRARAQCSPEPLYVQATIREPVVRPEPVQARDFQRQL